MINNNKQHCQHCVDDDTRASHIAFDRAISEGRLSNKDGDPLYAGEFMYMGQHEGKDMFKNINTREYLNDH